ncbi:MAG: NTP transferase domain-containing protein [Euryarchaeota archaeon]|jgi:glucose-1-phosphate thymidylyltransferase|nr:NTP transferase domain-containing protein [Euryarchaeota archaeon]MBT4981897.1 NTP transferase domain-containing protein [Euryarchaeota archaeon]MBT5183643.1 NTP transferase domain-containing protein [Euryarchaeota archaeon]
MKAIIVAGGHGSRLLPMTNHTHKTLLPLCGQPIIDYALATIRNSGITEITIIGNKFIDKIRAHVGHDVNYVLESEPKGVAAALQLAREHNENCPLLIWFSDNITNLNLKNEVRTFSHGAVLLTREVENPEDFGIAIMKNGEIVDVVEKPVNSSNKLAIGGIYMFDATFWQRLDAAQRLSDFSISDITKQYIKEGSAKVISVGENTWIDCGTPENLMRAAQMVEEGLFSIGVD